MEKSLCETPVPANRLFSIGVFATAHALYLDTYGHEDELNEQFEIRGNNTRDALLTLPTATRLMDLPSAALPDLSQNAPATVPLPPSSLGPTGQAAVWEEAPHQNLPRTTRFKQGTPLFRVYQQCLSEEASHLGKPELALIRLTGWLIYRAPFEEAEANLVRMVLDEWDPPNATPALAVGKRWRDFFLRICALFSAHRVGAARAYVVYFISPYRHAPHPGFIHRVGDLC
jgi:hypothetical protein